MSDPQQITVIWENPTSTARLAVIDGCAVFQVRYGSVLEWNEGHTGLESGCSMGVVAKYITKLLAELAAARADAAAMRALNDAAGKQLVAANEACEATVERNYANARDILAHYKHTVGNDADAKDLRDAVTGSEYAIADGEPIMRAATKALTSAWVALRAARAKPATAIYGTYHDAVDLSNALARIGAPAQEGTSLIMHAAVTINTMMIDDGVPYGTHEQADKIKASMDASGIPRGVGGVKYGLYSRMLLFVERTAKLMETVGNPGDVGALERAVIQAQPKKYMGSLAQRALSVIRAQHDALRVIRHEANAFPGAQE